MEAKMDQTKSTFEVAADDLEKSIKEDVENQELGKSLKDALLKTTTEFLAKGKGAITSDLSAEKDKRGELTGSSKDPAESPKKSGEGYKDSSIYEARKAAENDDDDNDDNDEDDMPSFFKKKHKKSKKVVKKSIDEDELELEDDEDDSDMDATGFIEDLGEAVDGINKSISHLTEGVAVFGELVAEMADPRRDNMLVNMAKAITHLVDENKQIKKSLEAHNSLMKSMVNLPGMPKIAGNQELAKSVGAEAPVQSAVLSKSVRDKLFAARMTGKLSAEDHQAALQSGDATEILKKL